MGKPTLLDTNDVTIIDCQKLGDATQPLETSEEGLKIAAELKDAFSRRRVVYLINHDVSEEEAKNLYNLFNKFLALPDDIKLKYKNKGKTDNHGYVPKNSEILYDVGKEEIRESFNVVGCGRDFPNEEIPEFYPAVTDICTKFLRLTNTLLRLFAIGQGVNPDFFVNCHKGIWNHHLNTSVLRMISYPAIEQEPHPGIIRCGEHTDFGTFTLLMQDSEGGLEVLGENGEWRRVGYMPGAIFLNTADLLEIWTSGELKATWHRVVVPEEKETRNRSRHSIVFFVQPDSTTVVKPLRPLPGAELKEYIADDYVNNRIDRAYHPRLITIKDPSMPSLQS